MELDISIILIQISNDVSLPHEIKIRKEKNLNLYEIETNLLLCQENEEYFDSINTQKFLEWFKQSGKIYKDNAMRKRNGYLKIEEDVILRTKELLKILNNELESIKCLKQNNIDLNALINRYLFQNIEITFDLYFEWFSITFNYWYSFDIYFIQANIFKKFFKDFLLNENNFDKEKRKELKKIFNETFKNIFNDFNLEVKGHLFSDKLDWNVLIFEEYKKVFVSMLQTCIEIQNEINLIFKLFSDSV